LSLLSQLKQAHILQSRCIIKKVEMLKNQFHHAEIPMEKA
jgi:hypothetical protein